MTKYWSGTKYPKGQLFGRGIKPSEIKEARKNATIRSKLAHLRDEDGFTKKDMECAKSQYDPKLIDLDEQLAVLLCGYCRHENCHERKQHYNSRITKAKIDACLADLPDSVLGTIANKRYEQVSDSSS